MTNREFAETNKEFLSACKEVKFINLYKNLSPSVCQASKWRRQKGIAWKAANNRIGIT